LIPKFLEISKISTTKPKKPKPTTKCRFEVPHEVEGQAQILEEVEDEVVVDLVPEEVSKQFRCSCKAKEN
jgi:hypothetical protein